MTLFTILLPTLLIHTLTTTMTLPQKIIHRQRVLFHLHVVAVAILPIQLMVVVMMTTMEGERCQPLTSPLMYVPLHSCVLFKMTMGIQSFSPLYLVIFSQRVVFSLPSNPLPPYIDYSMTVSMPSQNLGRERYFSTYAFGSLA